MITIRGLQEAQQDNLMRIAMLQPGGAIGRAIQYATTEAHRYAVSITHVYWYRGGGLRASHRIALQGDKGRVFIDPNAINPRGQRPAIYGPAEHAHGGSHAFYARTEREAGLRIAKAAGAGIARDLKV